MKGAAMKGAVLPVVMAVLLCVTLMVSALLNMPGGVLRKSRFLEKEVQSLYDGESRMLMYLNGIPDTSVTALPAGPWLELSTPVGGRKCLRVLAGRHLDSAAGMRGIPRQQKKAMVENFRLSLNREILLQRNLKIKSGNRRLIGRAENVSLVVQDGDLLVDYFGTAQSCNFKSSGSITLRGSASFDTLRLYASGPILLSGQAQVKWLEVFSSDQLEVAGEFRFSGALGANNQVILRQHALAEYPSILLSLNASVDYEPRNISGPLLLPANDLPSADFSLSGIEPIRWSLN